ERDRAEILATRNQLAELEAAIVGGRAAQLDVAVIAAQRRADSLGYLPLRARSMFLGARLASSRSHYDQAIASLHGAARSATAARDLGMLAEIWIELVQILGNDLRTLDDADVFDGYAEGLVSQLPDRGALELSLALARCNRNGTAATAALHAKHCQDAIDRAGRAVPPNARIANAARVRLGHFQRLQGEPALALATLASAVDEAVRVHGTQHPDTAVARYSLGIALISADRFDDGIAQLRQALAIRRAAFPAGSIAVAESLQGLGDALASKGEDKEAIDHLVQAIAMLDAVHQSASAHAANAHILLGMSLEAVKRDDDAIVHYLRGADIADRSLQHREALAAMGLRLASNLEAAHGRPANGIIHIERALRLQERGKSSPAELGKTQLRMTELLLATGDHARARTMGAAARASFVTSGTASAADLAELDRYLRQHKLR
nr:tetratricopeptide repeat protein [Deltaproteobacteria bacterium]